MESDYYLINNYSFFYYLTHKIESIFLLNIINAMFIAKLIYLCLFVIGFAFIFKKLSTIDYYALSIVFLIFVFLMIFLIGKQDKETTMNSFYSKIIKHEVHIPSLELIGYKISIYHITLFASFILFLIIRKWTHSYYLVLLLIPSVLMSLYYIYASKYRNFDMIKQEKIDINNSLIISLKKDEQMLKYHFKDNIFISDDYIFSDIIANYNHKIIEKSFFYLKYFDTNDTLKNALYGMDKINKNKINKDIFIYTDRFTLHNLYAIFNLASYDIMENKENDTFMDIDFIIKKLNHNTLYHKAITKKIYKTKHSILDLSKGSLKINNQEMLINNAFIVNDKVKKIQYNNNSKIKIISIIIDEQYMILCHQDYLQSFFIQALIFNNYTSSLVSNTYNQGDINIIKIQNPLKGTK